MKTYVVGGNYGNEFEMTEEQAARGYHQGACDDDVETLVSELDLSGINPETLRKELKEYGAWDAVQLADHQQNLRRWVWLCAGDIAEGRYDHEEGMKP